MIDCPPYKAKYGERGCIDCLKIWLFKKRIKIGRLRYRVAFGSQLLKTYNGIQIN